MSEPVVCENCGMGHGPDEMERCIEGHGDDAQVTLPVEVFDGIERMVRFVTQGLADGTLGTVRRAATPPPGREDVE